MKADLGVGLATTAAHVFDGVVGGVSGGADFDEEAAFNEGVGEAGAIWMLVMADRDGFDEAAFDVEASLVGGVLGGVSVLLMMDSESVDADGADLV